jgi:hypothetical protein
MLVLSETVLDKEPKLDGTSLLLPCSLFPNIPWEETVCISSLFVAGLALDPKFFISIASDCGLLSRVSLLSCLHVSPLAVLGGLLCSGIVPCLLRFSTVSFQRLRRTLRM